MFNRFHVLITGKGKGYYSNPATTKGSSLRADFFFRKEMQEDEDRP
jgi:hypothetical protein